MLMKHIPKGFTLIELMIVITIISLLLLFAVPSYQSYIQDSRRSEAQGALTGFANAMERFHSNNNTYEGAGPAGADTGAPSIYPDQTPLDSPNKHYNLTIQSANATSYTLRATPINGQAGDGYLELLSTTQRRWDEDDNGSIATGEFDWEKN